MTPAQKQMIAMATDTIHSHGAFGEHESHERVDAENWQNL